MQDAKCEMIIMPQGHTIVLHYAFYLLHSKRIPQGLWNVEKNAVEISPEKFTPQSLLKTYSFHTLGCG